MVFKERYLSKQAEADKPSGFDSPFFGKLTIKTDMEIKIKKLMKGAKLPQRMSEGAAAYDLFLPEDTYIRPGRQVISLGFSMEIPKGYAAEIQPRSGFASKGMLDDSDERMDADVMYGLIDSDYRGEVGVIIHSEEDYCFGVTKGMRIAQMIIRKVEDVEFREVESLSETERGKGGFGSTNKPILQHRK